MLKETANNGKDADVVREPGYARPEAADAADIHSYLHAGLARPGESVDYVAVRKRVDFDEDARRLAVFRLFDFPVYHFEHTAFQAVRGHEQVFVLAVEV